MKLTSLAEAPDEGVSHDPGIRKRVLLRNGDLPHLTTLARARFAPGQASSPHAHSSMAEVFLVESGEGEIRVDGAHHRLRPGVCAVVEPGEVHEIANTGTEDLVVTYLGVAV